MSDIADASQIDKNYTAFVAMLPSLMATHPNKYALMKDGQVLGAYSSLEDAYMTAFNFLKEDEFSVQKITDVPVDLGFFSHAVHIG